LVDGLDRVYSRERAAIIPRFVFLPARERLQRSLRCLGLAKLRSVHVSARVFAFASPFATKSPRRPTVSSINWSMMPALTPPFLDRLTKSAHLDALATPQTGESLRAAAPGIIPSLSRLSDLCGRRLTDR